MKSTAGFILMFAKVKTVKFVVGFNSFCHKENLKGLKSDEMHNGGFHILTS